MCYICTLSPHQLKTIKKTTTMKKIFCLSTLLFAALALAACSSPDPESEPKPIDTNNNRQDTSNNNSQNNGSNNQLQNGASPLDACFGEGKFGGNAWIEFISDKKSNTTDAIVCLVDVSSGEIIRNGYVRQGETFKMTAIPSGTYYLRVYYGNDWNPEKENFCGTKGGFNKDENFSKSDNKNDYIVVENSSYGYTTYSITLYSVVNGNMGSEKINASEFFKK